jgi:transposase InsO family protein
VSNDNAYSEALFKTLKYAPRYPSRPFEDIEKAREWVMQFVQWYNHSHRHSNLKYVTPAQRHQGYDREILEQRKQVYEVAKARNPERWSGDKYLDTYRLVAS